MVGVTGQDDPHVAARHDSREPVGLTQRHQFDDEHRRRHRRVVQDEHRPVRCRAGELVAQPHELVVGEMAAVVTRCGAVEHHDPQARDPVDAVARDRREAVGRRRGAQQLAAERRPLVVVAHRVDDRGAQVARERFDHRPQPPVGDGGAAVGEITGQQQARHRGPGVHDRAGRGLQVRVCVHPAVRQFPAVDEVDVAELDQGVAWHPGRRCRRHRWHRRRGRHRCHRWPGRHRRHGVSPSGGAWSPAPAPRSASTAGRPRCRPPSRRPRACRP